VGVCLWDSLVWSFWVTGVLGFPFCVIEWSGDKLHSLAGIHTVVLGVFLLFCLGRREGGIRFVLHSEHT